MCIVSSESVLIFAHDRQFLLCTMDSVLMTDVPQVDTIVNKKKNRNPFKWIARYLKNTNKREDKPFDFSDNSLS